MRMTETVKQLLIINIIFFIGSQFVANAYPLFSLYYPENPNFRIWQPLTSMFMHAPMPNLMHIVFNMFALVSFGAALEHYWGTKKFIFFYISCGLGSALLHVGVNYFTFHHVLNLLVENGQDKAEILKILAEGKYDTNWQNIIPLSDFNSLMGSYLGTAVGASGAIYGLLTAFAFMFPMAELGIMFIPIPIKAKYFVPGIIAIDLFLGFKGSSLFGAGGTGIAHFAHVGGAITGFLMMWYWKKNQFNKNRWD
jgi:membrane associated rhomboid family serine protease